VEEADLAATLRAKLISWVLISIVIPSAFSSRTASTTSPTSSGSSALVTSSSSSAPVRSRAFVPCHAGILSSNSHLER
jgi:hypothetical protein